MTTRVHNKRAPFDVYIGRPSEWGNLYVIGRDGTREEVVAKHRADLCANLPMIAYAKRELKGKVLGCWCGPDQLCHGDNWIDAAEGRLDSCSSPSSKPQQKPKPRLKLFDDLSRRAGSRR